MNRKGIAATGGNGSGAEHKNFSQMKSITIGDKRQAHVPGLVESWLAAAGAFGAEHARPSSEIGAGIGINRERDFRAAVECERREGALILASSHGLFLPAQGAKGRGELLRYVQLGESRIRGQARSLRRARQALKQLEGQFRIEEEGE